MKLDLFSHYFPSFMQFSEGENIDTDGNPSLDSALFSRFDEFNLHQNWTSQDTAAMCSTKCKIIMLNATSEMHVLLIASRSGDAIHSRQSQLQTFEISFRFYERRAYAGLISLNGINNETNGTTNSVAVHNGIETW